jgi:FKBP-type peptidyl-prolyl cis-trans isomerase FklB
MLKLMAFHASTILLFAFSPAFLVSVLAQEDTGKDQELVKKASLIIGYNVAKNMASQGIEIDREALLAGIQKGLDNAEFEMNEEEVESVMMAFQKYSERRQVEKMKRAAETNKAEGESYLAKNGAREGVKKLENGVQYEVLKEGSGDKPQAEDTVSIHYHGTLPDGTVFDSSVQRNEPAEFPVNRVVRGFSAALQAMKVGDKWKVVIPSDLAYGIQAPAAIGPNRTLIFEIELLRIVK